MAKQTAAAKEKESKGVNTEGKEWQDISHEAERTYIMPVVGGQIMDVKIDKPTDLQRLPNGGHIIKDSTGTVHEINSGWVKLSYKVK